MRAIVAVIAGCTLGLPVQAEDKAATEAIATNIQNLGHPRFSVREQAARNLVQQGEPALKALKTALASPDEEIRQRAAFIIKAIETRTQNAAILRAPNLRLQYENKPLDEVVADLSKKTGLAFVVDPKVANAKRPITIDTGEVAFWEAVEKVLAAGALVETFEAAPTATQAVESFTRGGGRQIQVWGGKRRVYSGLQPAAPVNTQIKLVECKSPVSAATGTLVRVKALPQGSPGNVATKGSNEVTIMLDVNPAPALTFLGIVGVDIRRAIDERSVALVQSHLGNPAGASNSIWQDGMPINVQFQGQGQVMIWTADSAMVEEPTTNARHVPVTLLLKDNQSRKLKELAGVVTVQALTPPQALITVENLLTAATKEEIRNGAYRLQIIERNADKGGYVQLRFKLETPAVNDVTAFPVRFNGRVQPFIQIDNGYVANGQTNLTLVDGNGKAITNHSLNVMEQTFNGNTQITDYMLVVPTRGAKSGELVKLTLTGRKSVFAEVPFVLKDLPLP
jgi:hypothetical protein